MTLAAVLKRMGRGGLTVHSFRSTFRGWAGEATAQPRGVVEAALAHRLQDKAVAAYARGDLFQKRRKLMRDWAEHLGRGHRRRSATDPPPARPATAPCRARPLRPTTRPRSARRQAPPPGALPISHPPSPSYPVDGPGHQPVTEPEGPRLVAGVPPSLPARSLSQRMVPLSATLAMLTTTTGQLPMATP